MKRSLIALALALGSAWIPVPVLAQSYPTKPVKMIVPVPPGGSSDLVARMTSNAAVKYLGQPIVFDNKPGATGNIGTVAAVKSPADGYTTFLCSIGNCSVNSSLYANPGFDLFKDVAPVVLLGSSINVLVVGPQSGINSMDDLLKKTKSNPLSYGSSGIGASNHLGGELLKKMASVDMLHVPYKGSGPAITDLLGGQIQVFFDNEPSIASFIKAGKVKALAVTGKVRSPNFPEIPTMEELGFKGFVIEPWYGVAAPAGVPKAIIHQINQAYNKALQDPEVKKSMKDAGINPLGGSADVMAKHIKSEHEKWGELIKSQKISAE